MSELTFMSGGQTGADQEGLRQARARHIATGGWAPRGWRTDEGDAPWLADYGLREASSSGYRMRTILNVRDSEVTVWFGTTSPGWTCTKEATRLYGRRFEENPTPAQFRALVLEFNILNIAGNRARTNPDAMGLVQVAFTGLD